MKTAHRPFLAKKSPKRIKKNEHAIQTTKPKNRIFITRIWCKCVQMFVWTYRPIHACLSTVELGGFFESSVALRVDKSPNGWRWKEDEEE